MQRFRLRILNIYAKLLCMPISESQPNREQFCPVRTLETMPAAVGACVVGMATGAAGGYVLHRFKYPDAEADSARIEQAIADTKANTEHLPPKDQAAQLTVLEGLRATENLAHYGDTSAGAAIGLLATIVAMAAWSKLRPNKTNR